MSIHIFLGPTMPLERARQHLDAVFHPPAEQGDVLHVLAERPTAIGIIDGYFEHVPSVWHKEILVALDQGIPVYGSASMGALRAAEMHPFGMVGVGRIFEWFRTGVLEDDDEVAVVHAPAEAGYAALSEAMVNIRDGLEAAAADGAITPVLAGKLIGIAKRLHYWERSYARVLRIARDEGADPEQLDQLAGFLKSDRPSLKERDAVAMLEQMALNRLAPKPLAASVQQTVFLEDLARQVGSAAANPADPVGETAEVARKKALLRLLARRDAARLGFEASSDAIRAAADDFRAQFGLLTAEATEEWLRSSGLTPQAFATLMRDAVLISELERRFEADLAVETAEQARLSTVRRSTETPR